MIESPTEMGGCEAALYTFDDLHPILEQPQIAARTAPIKHMLAILEAVADLARAAVVEDRLQEYNQWHTYALDYLEQARSRINFGVPNLREPLGRLMLFGTAGGSEKASHDLHQMLDADPAILTPVIAGCADLHIPPNGWIDRYAKSPTDKAQLLLAYNRQASNRHQGLLGSSRTSSVSDANQLAIHAEGVVLGQLDDGFVLDNASALLRTVSDAKKPELFSKLQKILEDEESISSHSHRNFQKFVMGALVDPALSVDAKEWLLQELYDQLHDVHELHDAPFESDRLYFTPVGELIADVADLHYQHAPLDSSNRTASDEVLTYASIAAIHNVQMEIAANLIPRISDNGSWSKNVMRFMYKFGSIDALLPDELMLMLEPQRIHQYKAMHALAQRQPKSALVEITKALHSCSDPMYIDTFLTFATKHLAQLDHRRGAYLAKKILGDDRILGIRQESSTLHLQTEMQSILAACGAPESVGFFAKYLDKIRRHIGEYAILQHIAGYRLAAAQAPPDVKIILP